jgi:transposase
LLPNRESVTLTVSNWIRAYCQECQTNDTAKSENELIQEVRQLQKKLAETEKENDFLKKAAAFFAKGIN